jgi:hypothetical protein
MSSEQIKGLLEPDQLIEAPAQEVEEPIQEVDAPSQTTDPKQILPDDIKASEILSAPPPVAPEPIGVTAVLKT